MANASPTPDFDLVTVKFAGTKLDGSPATGTIRLAYAGGTMLDEGDIPVSIFPTTLSASITAKDVTLDGRPAHVGYAEFQVPASNDPDIQGGGGTYTATIDITGLSTRTVTFYADINTPVVWLSRLAPVTPDPGEPVSLVTWDGVEQRISEATEGLASTVSVADAITAAASRVDTTLGRRVYIKDSSGAEHMVAGFTGVRDISGLIGNNWSLASSGLLRISREGNTVTLTHRGLTAKGTDTTVSTNALALGFRPTTNQTFPVRLATGAWSGALNVATGGQIYCTTDAQNVVNASSVSWFTSDPWPTTLPGTGA